MNINKQAFVRAMTVGFVIQITIVALEVAMASRVAWLVAFDRGEVDGFKAITVFTISSLTILSILTYLSVGVAHGLVYTNQGQTQFNAAFVGAILAALITWFYGLWAVFAQFALTDWITVQILIKRFGKPPHREMNSASKWLQTVLSHPNALVISVITAIAFGTLGHLLVIGWRQRQLAARQAIQAVKE